MCYSCAFMPPTNDPRWLKLLGGYKVRYDPRPALQKLLSNNEVSAAWEELWNELHHKGDVGEASYAAVPELVRIHCERGIPDWNTYALVATIELARDDKRNPPIPPWLEAEYLAALETLSKAGIAEISFTSEPESVRAIFAVIAISKGLRTRARIMLIYTDDELIEMEDKLLS